MAMANDDALRSEIEALLAAGLVTEVEPRAYTSEEVNQTVARLQQIAPDLLSEKLKVAGFTLLPYVSDDIEQACSTCMYYLTHRRFCELPELNLPAEPQWSCRLWRI
jgi:hypothetical protein